MTPRLRMSPPRVCGEGCLWRRRHSGVLGACVSLSPVLSSAALCPHTHVEPPPTTQHRGEPRTGPCDCQGTAAQPRLACGGHIVTAVCAASRHHPLCPEPERWHAPRDGSAGTAPPGWGHPVLTTCVSPGLPAPAPGTNRRRGVTLYLSCPHRASPGAGRGPSPQPLGRRAVLWPRLGRREGLRRR